MDNHQENQDFWYSLYQSFADTSDPRDELYPEIRSPVMVMSTPMAAIDELAEPWKVLENEGKEAGQKNDAAEVGVKNPNEVEKTIEKAMDKDKGKVTETEEPTKEENESLRKRARSNELRRIAEKRRRTNTRNKIDTLTEMTHCYEKKDYVLTLDFIVENIQKLKLYVESYSIGLMMPMGMRMNFPAPYMYPHIAPHFMMPYNYNYHYNRFPVPSLPVPGQPICYNNQIVPYTTEGSNNDQAPTTKPK